MRQIKILADERSAEALSDMLMDAGALSATIEDADAESTDEKPLYGEPGLEPDNCAWPRSIVSILADDVSDRLWIVPTWHDLPNEDAINVRLDPGVAFGTGSHPTTHLCLQWLDANVKATDRVLDYGCGTGILAIAAKLVGAAEVAGTDIDPQAVEAAGDNALMNHVEAKFYLPYDIVVANILANPLKLLAPALLGRVKQGGALVLSGVLAKQAEEVIAAYQAIDPAVKLSVWRQEEDWVCIAGRRA